jgi:hypothetical protein
MGAKANFVKRRSLSARTLLGRGENRSELCHESIVLEKRSRKFSHRKSIKYLSTSCELEMSSRISAALYSSKSTLRSIGVAASAPGSSLTMSSVAPRAVDSRVVVKVVDVLAVVGGVVPSPGRANTTLRSLLCRMKFFRLSCWGSSSISSASRAAKANWRPSRYASSFVCGVGMRSLPAPPCSSSCLVEDQDKGQTSQCGASRFV